MVNPALVPLLLALPLAGGCVEVPPADDPPATLPPQAPTTRPYRTNRRLGGEPLSDLVQTGVHLPRPALRPMAPPAKGPATLVGPLLPTLTGGAFDPAYGTGLAAAWAELDEERAALGLAGLTYTQWTSALAGCEDPRLRLPLSHQGADWEVVLDVPALMWLAERPWRDDYTLPETCVQALQGTAGDPSAAVGAGCEDADEQAFFAEGTACRDCLAVDGDHARCVAEASCAATATRQVEIQGAWRSVLRASALQCAPDFVGELVFLASDLPADGSVPGPYDHGSLDLWCIEVWSSAQAETTLACSDATEVGMTWGDVLVSRIELARPVGSDESHHQGRLSAIDGVEAGGITFPYTAVFASGVTALSAPTGSADDAWGIDPLALRPDGTDPTDPSHTLAREYVAALILKTSTTIDGIIVQPFNHNRCADGGWSGPHADGSWSCDRPGAWSSDGWLDDGWIAWWGSGGDIYPMPLLTLVSTGLPDPGVPGGLSPRVLSSTTLGDPEWEACAWPETFTPDRIRMWDDAPATGGAPYASFDGQTWRFGRDDGDGDGVIMGLLTSQQRDFCP